jgi:hypothetical protein
MSLFGFQRVPNEKSQNYASRLRHACLSVYIHVKSIYIKFVILECYQIFRIFRCCSNRLTIKNTFLEMYMRFCAEHTLYIRIKYFMVNICIFSLDLLIIKIIKLKYVQGVSSDNTINYFDRELYLTSTNKAVKPSQNS